MRKPILAFGARVLLFLVLFLVGYLGTVVFAVNLEEGRIRGLRFTNIPYEAPTFGGQSSYMFDELDTISDIDVLWTGSSHAYRTFDPRFFDERGVSTFNMGTTAQTPLNTYYLLREYLDDIQPDVVVLEVYWNVLTWDGVESTMDILANTDPAPWMLQMAVATRDIRAVNAFLGRLVDLRRPEIARVQPNLFDGDTYISRGFVEKDPAFSGTRTWPPGDLVVLSRQMDYLERTVDFVKSVRIPIVLITQPLPTSTLRAITNREELHTAVRHIAERHDVPYVDYNGSVTLDDAQDYFDSHHLSQRGLNTFLPLVYDTLVDLGFVSNP